MNTHNLVKILLMGLLLGLFGLSLGNLSVASVMEDARSESWQTENLEALNALLSDKPSVSAFIKEVNSDIKPQLRDLAFEPTLCEYELTDLANDGMLELVATLDSSGRLFCNELIVVQKINEVFHAFSVFAPGTSFLDLKSRIVDLNHDGIKELLVPRLLAPYDGANPIPIINDVYEWDGAGLCKANASFKEYYRSLLPRLKSELDAVRQGRKLDVPSHKDLLEKKYERENEEVDRILNE